MKVVDIYVNSFVEFEWMNMLLYYELNFHKYLPDCTKYSDSDASSSVYKRPGRKESLVRIGSQNFL